MELTSVIDSSRSPGVVACVGEHEAAAGAEQFVGDVHAGRPAERRGLGLAPGGLPAAEVPGGGEPVEQAGCCLPVGVAEPDAPVRVLAQEPPA